jgi:plastocyanin
VPGDQEKVSDVAVIVNYSDEGFSPNLVEINQGDVVEFVNQSSRPMWVASNSHPAHDVLSTFDQFTVSGFGESWQYSFDQKGEWKYHDHVNASIEGVVIVR